MATQRNFTAEEVQKKFDALPQEIKALLYSPEMVSAIQKIGEKNKLHYDQMGVLETETSNVMLGFTDMQDYVPMLMRSLDIDRAQAEAVAKDVNDALFTKVRDAMKKADEKNASTSAAGEPAQKELSVVMPSAAKAPTAAPVLPTAEPIKPAAPAAAMPASAPPKPMVPSPSVPMIAPTHAAEVMLNETTVNLPKKIEAPPAPATTTPPSASAQNAEPPKPSAYKTDPYREPPE